MSAIINSLIRAFCVIKDENKDALSNELGQCVLKELEENSITYDLQDVVKLNMTDIKLPWR